MNEFESSSFESRPELRTSGPMAPLAGNFEPLYHHPLSFLLKERSSGYTNQACEHGNGMSPTGEEA